MRRTYGIDIDGFPRPVHYFPLTDNANDAITGIEPIQQWGTQTYSNDGCRFSGGGLRYTDLRIPIGDYTKSFTIYCEIKADMSGGHNTAWCLGGFKGNMLYLYCPSGDSKRNRYILGCYGTGNGALLRDYNQPISGSIVYVFSSFDANSGLWQVYYIDDGGTVSYNSSDSTLRPATSGYPYLTLGCCINSNRAVDTMNGYIRNVKIWDKALTKEQMEDYFELLLA